MSNTFAEPKTGSRRTDLNCGAAMRTPARRGQAGALDLPLLSPRVSFLKLMGLL